MHTHARTQSVLEKHLVLIAVHQLHPLVQRPVHPCEAINQSTDANEMRDKTAATEGLTDQQKILPTKQSTKAQPHAPARVCGATN
jgi:hypothetical protein